MTILQIWLENKLTNWICKNSCLPWGIASVVLARKFHIPTCLNFSTVTGHGTSTNDVIKNRVKIPYNPSKAENSLQAPDTRFRKSLGMQNDLEIRSKNFL